MSKSFSALKKSRNNTLDNIRKKIESQTQSPRDETYWRPTVDNAGNGSAVVRPLPAPMGEDMPWARYFDHVFKGPGGWYGEMSLTTLGKDDPVSEYNSELWATELDSNRNIARRQKRRLNYVINIYVVKDKMNPDAEGKVFKYRIGKKLFDLFEDAMTPDQDTDQDPINPFDLWEGANLNIVVRKQDNFQNYDKSKFSAPGPLKIDGKEASDDQLEEIWKQCYSLADIISSDKFKSYDELKTRMVKVLGLHSAQPTVDQDEIASLQSVDSASIDEDDDIPFDTGDSLSSDSGDVDQSEDEDLDIKKLMERIASEDDD